jgi:hypothetical protein
MTKKAKKENPGIKKSAGYSQIYDLNYRNVILYVWSLDGGNKPRPG